MSVIAAEQYQCNNCGFYWSGMQMRTHKFCRNCESILTSRATQMWGNLPYHMLNVQPGQDPDANAGFVYLAAIENTNTIKIGRSWDVQKRIWTLNTNNPNRVVLVYTSYVSDNVECEKRLLSKFWHKRIDGEWYQLEDDDITELIYMIDEMAIHRIIKGDERC